MNRKAAAIAGGVLVVALGAFFAWTYLAQPEAPVAAPPVASTAPVAAPASAPAPAAAPSPAAAAPVTKPAGATEVPPTIYDNLQNRLDALARAYTAGDAAAAERAMWPNHAVVRPNGDTLDRSALLGQWMTEFVSLQDRKLSFAISEVYVDDDQVTAYWSMELTAKILGEDNELHDFEARGLQKAIFRSGSGVDFLDGPILYHGYEQTWDGMLFNPQ